MLNNHIKELRKAKKMTQMQLAQATGYTQFQIAKWENNNSKIKISAIIKLAIFFGVTSDYLLGLED